MPVDAEAAGIDVHLAARSGDVQVVRSLISRPGTDVEARDILGDTALLKAVRYGHTEVCAVRMISKCTQPYLHRRQCTTHMGLFARASPARGFRDYPRMSSVEHGRTGTLVALRSLLLVQCMVEDGRKVV